MKDKYVFRLFFTFAVLLSSFLLMSCSGTSTKSDLTEEEGSPPQLLPHALINPQLEIQRIAFGSNNNQKRAQTQWKTILQQKPDAFIFTSNPVFATQALDRPFAKTYQKLLNSKDFQNFRTLVPIFATWGGKNYGAENLGKDNPDKLEAAQSFKDFFPQAQILIPEQQEGIYYSLMIGPEGRQVHLIFLDDRWFNDKPNTVLGETQWLWLQKQLKTQADLRILVTSLPLLSENPTFEKWSHSPGQRNKLLGLIKQSSRSVVVLSGGQNFAELSVMNLPTRIGKKSFAELVELTSSPLNSSLKDQDDEPPAQKEGPNKFRKGKIYPHENFGLLDIYWKTKRLRGSILNRDGKQVLSYETHF